MTETYDLFFTGKDDPRTCVIIGEDTKPVFFSFETFDRDLTVNTRTIVGTKAGTQGGVIIYPQVTRGKDLLASLEWSPGNHMGMAIVGTRRIPMSHLVLPSPTNNAARNFVSASDGRRYEWRRCYPDTSAYDLFVLPTNMRIAVFRRMEQRTVVGPATGIMTYGAWNNDLLLLESLLSLCLFRWIDLHGL